MTGPWGVGPTGPTAPTGPTGSTGTKGLGSYTESATAPTSPVPGAFWYDLTTGVLSIWVNDGNSSQWLQIAPAPVGPTGPGGSGGGAVTYLYPGGLLL